MADGRECNTFLAKHAPLLTLQASNLPVIFPMFPRVELGTISDSQRKQCLKAIRTKT